MLNQQQVANYRVVGTTIAAGLYLLLLCGHVLLPAVEPFALFLAVAMCTATVAVARLPSSDRRIAIQTKFGMRVVERLAKPSASDVSQSTGLAEFYDKELKQLEVELEALENQLQRDAAAQNMPLLAGQGVQFWPNSGAAAD
ncbi:MAG: hypothetical protein V3U76_19740 [Granulosicoccus sp.]